MFVSNVTPVMAVAQMRRLLSAVETAPDGDYEINVTSEFTYLEQTSITDPVPAPDTQIITIRRLV